MTKTHTQGHSLILLTLIGAASSYILALTVTAAGFMPSEVITLANGARTKAHLTVLTESAVLAQAAKNKANDMIKNDYFAHTSPKGVEPWYWIKEAGYHYQAAGENLAINYTDAREQHDAWMKSETHRANIMSTRYRDIGVAVVKGKIDGKESLITVEYFGTPLAVVADQVKTAPTAVPAVGEIRGMETEEGTAPVQPTATLPAPVVLVAPVVPDVPMALVMIVSLALILLSLTLVPAVFLVQALRILFGKNEETEVCVRIIAPLDMDAIHHEAVH